jgi:hypothetical protein
MRPGSAFGWARSGKESARVSESDRESPAGAAPAAVEREPARKHVARESGYGSSGRESSGGTFQGRERHGTRPRSVGDHGERRGPKGLERAASQPQPSRGARTLRTAPTGVWRPPSHTHDRKEARGGEGAPDVDRVRGNKNPTRGRPARLPNGSVPSRRGRTGEGASGRRRSSRSSGEDLTPRG